MRVPYHLEIQGKQNSHEYDRHIGAGVLLSVIVSFSVLLTGCYSHNAITAESPKSEYEVSFRLKDGTHILSQSYERAENGWKVEGKWVNREDTKATDFSGILLDAQVKEVVTNEFNTGLTIVGVLLGGGFVTFSVGWIVESVSH